MDLDTSEGEVPQNGVLKAIWKAVGQVSKPVRRASIGCKWERQRATGLQVWPTEGPSNASLVILVQTGLDWTGTS